MVGVKGFPWSLWALRVVFRNVGRLLREAYREWDAAQAPRLGAALAYYSVLSLAPALLLLLALAGLILEPKTASADLLDDLRRIIGGPATQAIEEMLSNPRQASPGWLSSITSFAILLFGASGVFNEFQAALNAIWQAGSRTRMWFWGILRDRLISFLALMAAGLLLLASTVATTALAGLSRSVAARGMPGGTLPWEILNNGLSLAVIMAMLAIVFKVLPDAHVPWKDVWLGAALTSVLFVLGKMVLGLYVRHANIASSYGAAGSLVVLLVWVYYSAQIILFGAAFTRAYSKECGSCHQS